MISARYSPLWAGITLWVALVGAGLWHLTTYANTPGDSALTANSWPQNTTLSPDSHVPVLIMAVHPYCPCSRASISELARLTAVCQGKVKTRVLFVLPKGMTANVEKTPLWSSVVAIPGIEVIEDLEGIEAARLGALTSGQCYLFAPDGRRLFAGGITSARAHEGDNPGCRAIRLLLTQNPDGGKAASTLCTPVFGCPLTSPEEKGLSGKSQ